jgi:signal peptidase I
MAHSKGMPVDTRVIIYRFIRDLALCLLLIFAFRYFFCDTVRIKTDQMSPSLISGDRVALLRTPYAVPFSMVMRPRIGSMVVFDDPFAERKLGCLRVAATSGDSIIIANGQFVNITHPKASFAVAAADSDLVPPDFSPRDFMAPLVVPHKGRVYELDSLDIRDFFFIASLMKQENPGSRFVLKPQLFIDGQERDSFSISGFSLYTGSFDSIPERFRYDFFFWDRLRAYLQHATDQSVSFLFPIFNGQERIFTYRIKGLSVFLLADDWYKGFDSRYFGLISVKKIKGSAGGVLWSFDPEKRGPGSLRIGRIGKLVR